MQYLHYDSRHAYVKIKLYQAEISNKCNIQNHERRNDKINLNPRVKVITIHYLEYSIFVVKTKLRWGM